MGTYNDLTFMSLCLDFYRISLSIKPYSVHLLADELLNLSVKICSELTVLTLIAGMNLVAKEFVACQINKPPGVLVVSPFAGAGETMQEALVCNPYETEHAADVIHRYVSILLLITVRSSVV